MQSFAVGDCAVYYGRGVGVVIDQEDQDPRGSPCEIFVLQLEKSVARVRADDPETSTIRPVMSKELLEQVYETLADRSTKPSQTTWNRRYREYVQKIQSGEPLEVAMVLRDLELLSIRKSLSFGESKIYSQARNLVIEEGAFVEIEGVLVALEKRFHNLSKKLLKPDEFLKETFTSFFALYRDEYTQYIERINKIQKELENKEKDTIATSISSPEFSRLVKELEQMNLSDHLPLNNNAQLRKKLSELEHMLLNIQLFSSRSLVVSPIQPKKRMLVKNLEFLLENLDPSSKEGLIRQATVLYHTVLKNGVRNDNATVELDALVDLFRAKSLQTKEKIDMKIKSLFKKERKAIEEERAEQENKKSKKSAAPKE